MSHLVTVAGWIAHMFYRERGMRLCASIDHGKKGRQGTGSGQQLESYSPKLGSTIALYMRMRKKGVLSPECTTRTDTSASHYLWAGIAEWLGVCSPSPAGKEIAEGHYSW